MSAAPPQSVPSPARVEPERGTPASTDVTGVLSPAGGNAFRRITLLTVGGYAVVGAIWIVFSDAFIERVVSSRELLMQISIIKGWAFIALTGGLLYLTLSAQYRRLHRETQKRERATAALLESQALYLSLVQQMPAGVFRKDAQGRYVFVNELFCELLGLTASECIGHTPAEIATSVAAHRTVRGTPASNAIILERGTGHHDRIVATGERIEIEEEWLQPDGRRRVLQTTKTAVRDASGRIVGSQGILIDITERRRSEAVQRVEQERYRSLFENMLNGFAYCRMEFEGDEPRDFTYLAVNRAFESLTGLKDAVGKSVSDLIPGFCETDRALLERYGRIARTGTAERFEVYVNALQQWYSVAVYSPVPNDFIALFEDITERKRSEGELRLFRNLVDQSDDGFEVIDPETGRLLDVNEKCCNVLGYTRAELLARTISDIETTLDPVHWPRLVEALRCTGALAGEGLHRRKDGTTFPIELTAKCVRLDREYIVAVVRDVSRRRRSEEQVRILSRAVEQSPASIVITDPSGKIEYVNPRFTEVTGYTALEVLGKNPRVLRSGQNSPELYKNLWTTITAGREWRGEFLNRRKTGDMFWESALISPVTDTNGRITHFVAVKEDITERRNLESQLRRSQRMEAIGALASGVAHDLNNILAPVRLAPSLLREHLPGEEERLLLAMIEQSAERGAGIVGQLLAFSRGGGGERVQLQLRHLIKEIRHIVEETFPRDITIRVDIERNLAPVLGNATQLHQVLLNLFVNARDAMPNGGTLSITASNVDVDAELARANAPARPGRYVRVTVADTGHGIPAEILDRIFDPFFTTKEIGKGTGLGLSTVAGIVGGHDGFITVQSTVGQGACFTVYLPTAPTDQPVPPNAPIAPPPRGRGQLILVVDDEASVTRASELTLVHHGYRVITARNGVEALAQFQRHAADVALVFTDVMMPEMNGVRLIQELRRIAPAMKFIVTSGIASEAKRDDLAALGITEVLPKPYSATELLEHLTRELADGEGRN